MSPSHSSSFQSPAASSPLVHSSSIQALSCLPFPSPSPSCPLPSDSLWVPLPLGSLLSFSRPQVCVSTWPLSSVAPYLLSPLHPHPTKRAWILLYKAGPFIHRGLTPTQRCLCPGGSEPNGDRGMSVPLRQALSTFVGLSLFWCVAESCLHSPIPRVRAHTYTLTHTHSSLTNSNPNSQSRESKRLSLHHQRHYLVSLL